MMHRYNNLSKGEFVVIYGRRRLGKSELAKEFLLKAKGAQLAVLIPNSSKDDVLLHFERDIERSIGITKPLRNWDDLFSLLEGLAKKEKIIVVFDEVQRLHTIDNSFFSSLQKWWDDSLKYLPIYIVMIGSAIGLMQKVFLSAASPLFSRKTWSYLIEPFNYIEFRMMFEKFSEYEKVALYSIFGGTPAYLAHVKTTQGDINAKIESLCLKKGAALFDEPAELLRTELKRSDRYTALLHAMSNGRTGQKEIADFAGFTKPNEANPYLDILRKGLHIIKRADPVGGKKKRGRYLFKDNYFNFWYRYIHPLQSVLELGNINLAKEHVQKNLPSYMGLRAEDVVRELLTAFNGKNFMGLTFNFKEIGSWWTQKDNSFAERAEEIDIVALGDDYVLLGEVEWSNQLSRSSLLFDLLRKGKLFPLRLPQKYLLFSRSGFTDECLVEMKKVGCISLTLKNLEELFEQATKAKPSR